MAPLPHSIARNPRELLSPRIDIEVSDSDAADAAGNGLNLASDSASNLSGPWEIAGIVIGLLIFILFVYIAIRNQQRKKAKAIAEASVARSRSPSPTPSPEKPYTGTWSSTASLIRDEEETWYSCDYTYSSGVNESDEPNAI
ncbi:hypothetical protein C8R45DRAFT_1078042 [Mycena sanguinolenta]|nr:hypothetical protein C8R45DRAFT_1078042 [Mycena sanguinolenta]